MNNQLKHVPFGAAVALVPNTDYYLVGQEVAGGNYFYSYNTAVITTGVAAPLTAIYSSHGTTSISACKWCARAIALAQEHPG